MDSIPIRLCDECGQQRILIERAMEGAKNSDVFMPAGIAMYASCGCGARQSLDAEDLDALGLSGPDVIQKRGT